METEAAASEAGPRVTPGYQSVYGCHGFPISTGSIPGLSLLPFLLQRTL